MDSLTYNAENLPRLGEHIRLPRMTIEVTGVNSHGLPTEVTFSFTGSPEDPSLVWLWWDWHMGEKGSYLPFAVPDIGKTITIPGPFKEDLKVKKQIIAIKAMKQPPSDVPHYEGRATPGMCALVGEILKDASVCYAICDKIKHGLF